MIELVEILVFVMLGRIVIQITLRVRLLRSVVVYENIDC